MIILITGPTGAGKTDTSWALLERGSPMVFLDCDWFAARRPFSWQRPADVESVYQGLSAMLEHHIARGACRFVIPLTVEMALTYEVHKHYFARFGLPLFAFRLSCSEEVLKDRILKRDRDPHQRSWELEAILSQPSLCILIPETFAVLDASEADEKDVAARIWNIVQAATSENAVRPRIAADAPKTERR